MLIVALALVLGCTAQPSLAGSPSGFDPELPPGAPPVPGEDATVVLVPGTDPAASTRFGGVADPSRAPEIVYPAHGVFVPPNLGKLAIHFRPGGHELFELTFATPSLVIAVYTSCRPLGDGCVYEFDEATWTTLAAAARGQGPVPYAIRGTGAAGGPVGTSEPRSIVLVEQDVVGGLYYWNAAAGTIVRYDFGLGARRAETYLDPARAGATECVGCHALSRDGSRIAVGLDEPGPSRMLVYDVATRTQVAAFGTGEGGTGANFFAFSPDATQIAASDGRAVSIVDARSGDRVATVGGVQGTMPDWSPDGSRIVYADTGAVDCAAAGEDLACTWPTVRSARLGLLERSGGEWRRGPVLVERAADNLFYPTFSPDGAWVLYNRSAANDLSYDDSQPMHGHELWAVATRGGAPLQLLHAASRAGDGWPKWDPTAYQHRGRPLFWISFASARPYGLHDPAGGRSQIWIAAFLPARAEAGEDPAMPALWLPYQDPETGNHIAQWVTRVERQGCSDDSACGAGELCSPGGECLPDLI